MAATLLDQILIEERRARNSLTKLRAERDAIEAACRAKLDELNRLKREAYRLGFTGNIMRDANGNRVNTLPPLETREPSSDA